MFRGYYKGGVPITIANFGDVITYDVPGSLVTPGQIWLEQTVNGKVGYTGPLSVPMAPYTLRQGQDQAGQWSSTAFQLVNGQKGPFIESAGLYVTTPSAGAPTQGSVTSSTTQGGGGGGGTNVNVSAAIGPSLTPGSPGAIPTGSTVGQTPTLTRVYRFVLQQANGYATGANYAGCSQVNSGMCDPQFFTTLDEVMNYAATHNETPYWVYSANEPWAIIDGTEPIDPSHIIGQSSGFSMGTLALIAGAAYLLFRRKG